ncbi:MAG: hypothetical protein KDD53_12280, partial [Bdellovibrionales bacterium]|nr:hypothetical protein [Bdellovibrionales bacterium]
MMFEMVDYYWFIFILAFISGSAIPPLLRITTKYDMPSFYYDGLGKLILKASMYLFIVAPIFVFILCIVKDSWFSNLICQLSGHFLGNLFGAKA